MRGNVQCSRVCGSPALSSTEVGTTKQPRTRGESTLSPGQPLVSRAPGTMEKGKGTRVKQRLTSQGTPEGRCLGTGNKSTPALDTGTNTARERRCPTRRSQLPWTGLRLQCGLRRALLQETMVRRPGSMAKHKGWGTNSPRKGLLRQSTRQEGGTKQLPLTSCCTTFVSKLQIAASLCTYGLLRRHDPDSEREQKPNGVPLARSTVSMLSSCCCRQTATNSRDLQAIICMTVCRQVALQFHVSMPPTCMRMRGWRRQVGCSLCHNYA